MSEQIISDVNYLIGKSINNSKNFIYEFNQFKQSRNFGDLAKVHPNLFEQLLTEYNKYILSNGLFVRKLLQFPLNEYYSFVFNILTRNTAKYKNNWYNYIQNHIFNNYDNDITSIKLESLEYINEYYSDMLPRKIKKLCKNVNQTNFQSREHKLNSQYPNKLIDGFIKIGECCKYDVKGFYDNELLYLLCGICIVDGINRIKAESITSFKQLFEFVKSYLQLWQFNKVLCLTSTDTEHKTNLVTHIKCNGKYVKRYKDCEKYFADYHPGKNKTNYVIDHIEDKIYIETKIDTSSTTEVFNKLEQLYKECDNVGLYYTYVTNQLLTRSSCLSALIILNILSYVQVGKLIKTNKNEQLDWFAISRGIDEFKKDFNNYTTEVELKNSDEFFSIEPLKVGDVLCCTHTYIAIQLSK